MYLKQRLFALVLILGFAGLTYYNWHQLWEKNEYSLKLAAFGPLGVVGGFFLLLFPTMMGKPNTTQVQGFRFTPLRSRGAPHRPAAEGQRYARLEVRRAAPARGKHLRAV